MTMGTTTTTTTPTGTTMPLLSPASTSATTSTSSEILPPRQQQQQQQQQQQFGPTTQFQKKQMAYEKQLQRELLRSPLLVLAKKGEYDEIWYILRNMDLDLRNWLQIESFYSNQQQQQQQDTNHLVCNNKNNINQEELIGTTTSSFSDGCQDNNNNLVPAGTHTRMMQHQQQQQQQQQQWKGGGCCEATIVHQMMQYHPPVEIVDLVIQRMKQYCDRTETIPTTTNYLHAVPELSLDLQGKTPLHVAVTKGCSIDIIERLVKINPSVSTTSSLLVSPAMVPDHMGRYPLHWACTNPKKSMEHSTRIGFCFYIQKQKTTTSYVIDNFNLYKVMKLLINEYPNALFEVDTYQCRPIELAKQHGVTNEMIQLLMNEEQKFMIQKTNKQQKRNKNNINIKENRNQHHQHHLNTYKNESGNRSENTLSTCKESTSSPDISLSKPILCCTDNNYEDENEMNHQQHQKNHNVSNGMKKKNTISQGKKKKKKKKDTNHHHNNNKCNEERGGGVSIPNELEPENIILLCDTDDLSSVGSGGISKYRRPCKPIHGLPYIPEQFQI